MQGWNQGGGGGGGTPNPENQFENGAKFLCLKGKGRTISVLASEMPSVATKSHKTVMFQPPRAC